MTISNTAVAALTAAAAVATAGGGVISVMVDAKLHQFTKQMQTSYVPRNELQEIRNAYVAKINQHSADLRSMRRSLQDVIQQLSMLKGRKNAEQAAQQRYYTGVGRYGTDERTNSILSIDAGRNGPHRERIY